jgi:formate transporter
MENAPQFVDAHAPRDIARRVQRIGVTKAQTDTLTLAVLAVLAGAFISFGALLYTVLITDSRLGFGATRLLGGLGFCLGLVLVVVAQSSSPGTTFLPWHGRAA